MHPGEEKIYIFPDHRPLRLVNGEVPKIYNNAVYYSTKSVAKPVPAMRDSSSNVLSTLGPNCAW
jgi:hypothetical protein